MENSFNKELLDFVALALQGKNENVELFKAKFENKVFENESQNMLKLLVVKGFDPAFSHLRPLANYLVEKDYCKMDKTLITYAVAQGIGVEMALNKLKNTENMMNDDFSLVNTFTGGSFKVVNEPLDNLHEYAKIIVLKASDEEIEEAKKEIFKTDKLLKNIDDFDLFKRSDNNNTLSRKIKP